jgi:hypothetical protein
MTGGLNFVRQGVITHVKSSANNNFAQKNDMKARVHPFPLRWLYGNYRSWQGKATAS